MSGSHRLPRRLLRSLAMTVGALALVLTGASPADAAGARYVALGDSYSAGVGAGSYIASSGDCLRSTNAFSALWAATHATSSYVSVACSGATTSSVRLSQLAALSAATTLVSITVGGNDVNFTGVMTDCVLYGTSRCLSEVNAAESTALTVLPARLDALYPTIRGVAPNARVVVLSYPLLYHVGVWYCIGLSDTARAKINEGANVLDGVVQAAAARSGFAFADVRPAFAAGHEICDGNSWLHSVDFSNLRQSYHPTASGQSGGYLPAFTAAADS